jgi:HAMP domain-containing protein
MKIVTGFLNISIGTKLAIMGSSALMLSTIVLVLVGAWQSSVFNAQAQAQVEKLIDKELDDLASSTLNLIAMHNEQIQGQIDTGLEVGHKAMDEAGRIRLTNNTTLWLVTNRFTRDGQSVELPKMYIGGTVVSRNDMFTLPSPIVDDVGEIAGVKSSIFQRMNEDGDMVQVMTNIADPDGTRAVGTYIPATNPDGSPNPVVSTLLHGETYRGREFVADDWYQSAYEPLLDTKGQIIGAFYVGVKEGNMVALRQAIINTPVGETGYIYVIGGQGSDRGHYIISQNGKRDGENIWETQDADGSYVIRSIVNKGIALGPGELATERYPWQNAGDPAPRWKVARIAYYEPWDWVIGVSTYEDDYDVFRNQLLASRRQMIQNLVLAGIGVALLGGIMTWLFAQTIIRPLKRVTRAADHLAQTDLPILLNSVKEMAQGNLNTSVELRLVAVESGSQDELGQMANAFNQMNRVLTDVGTAMNQTISSWRELVSDLAHQANQVHVASEQMTHTANRSSTATTHITDMIAQVVQGVPSKPQISAMLPLWYRI